MSAIESFKKTVCKSRKAIKSHPYKSLSLFVIIVVVVSLLGYARYQHVQAELAAQRNLVTRVQRGLDNWRDDLSTRFSDLKDDLRGTADDAGHVVGGVWRIIRFVVTAILDYVGNLHIMIPVTIIYFGVGFFGTLKMRVATLIGALIALWWSTNAGIVTGSIIGLLAIAGLLFWNKIDPRLLSAIQGLPAKLISRIQEMRVQSDDLSASEAEQTVQAEDSQV